MSLFPAGLLGRELNLVLPLVLGVAVLAKQATEKLLSWRTVRGERSGWFGSGCLFLSYVVSLGLALWCLAAGLSHVAAIAGGAVLWALAASLRIWAMAHLREQFSYVIEVREEHRLVETGPYAVIRHPLHFGFALEVTAFAVISGAPPAVAPVALVWITVALRNRTEEKALRDHFGQVWDEYVARVPSMNFLRGLARNARRRHVH